MEKIEHMKLLTMSVYFMSIVMFFSQQSIFSFWLMMEVNLLTFIMILTWKNSQMKSKHSLDSCFFYMIIQIFSSMLFLMTMLTSDSSEVSNMAMFLFVMIKSGMFPAHSWMFKWTKKISTNSLLLLLTTQKIPVIILLLQMEQEITMIILSMNLIAGLILMANSFSLREMMVSSSIYGMIIYTLSWLMSLKFFLSFLALYLVSMMAILKSEGESTKWMNMKMLMGFGFLMGIPPMSLFFLKMYFLNTMVWSTSFTALLMIWAGSYFSSMFYFKMCFNSLKTLAQIFESKKYTTLSDKILLLSVTQILVW